MRLPLDADEIGESLEREGLAGAEYAILTSGMRDKLVLDSPASGDIIKGSNSIPGRRVPTPLPDTTGAKSVGLG
jgi:hypothetical protein